MQNGLARGRGWLYAQGTQVLDLLPYSRNRAGAPWYVPREQARITSMGLFDFFKSKGSTKSAPADDKTLAKHAERVLDKRALSPDRFASIEFLCRTATPEAWRAVLPRFNFSVDPSITDREEKQYIFDAVVAAPDNAVEPLCEFLRTAESLNWPVKMLRKIVDREKLVSELLALLSTFDTGYARHADRKAQIIAELEEETDPRVPPAVVPFLKDFSEDVRFQAVRTLFRQGDAQVGAAPLAKLFVDDDSARIRSTIVDGFAESQWAVPTELRDPFRAALRTVPTGPWTLTADGTLRRN